MADFKPTDGRCRRCGRYRFPSHNGVGCIPEDWGDTDPDELCETHISELAEPECDRLYTERLETQNANLKKRVREAEEVFELGYGVCLGSDPLEFYSFYNAYRKRYRITKSRWT